MHVTTTVHLTAERLALHHGNVDDALEDILDTFDADGDAPPRMVFEDREAAWRKEYARPQMRDRHASFESFCKDEHDMEAPDPQTGRWGYWNNANAQWDWWRVGGRWSGYYPLRSGVPCRLGTPTPAGAQPTPGFGDIVHPWEIDTQAVARTTAERAAAFADAYAMLLADPRPGVLDDGDRDRALRLGLLRCEEGPAVAQADDIVFPWFAPGPRRGPAAEERDTWTAVARQITRHQLLTDYAWAFDPLPTFAAVTDDGWFAPDMSAWFGLSDETPEVTRGFSKTFVERFIVPAKGDDLLVLVDCHL